VRYHDMRSTSQKHKFAHFAVVRNHDIDFILEPLPADMDDNKVFTVLFTHGGSAICLVAWTDAGLRITWHCKWSIRGLSPIRLVVTVLAAMSIPAKPAIKLGVMA